MTPIVVFESINYLEKSKYIRRIAWDGQNGLTFHSYGIGPKGGLLPATATGFTIDEIKEALDKVADYLKAVEEHKRSVEEAPLVEDLTDALYSILNIEGLALRGGESMPEMDVGYHFTKVRAAITKAERHLNKGDK